MPVRNDLEKIRINWLAHLHLKVEFFPDLSGQALRRGLARFNSPARQFPFLAFVEHENHFALWRKKNTLDRYRVHDKTYVTIGDQVYSLAPSTKVATPASSRGSRNNTSPFWEITALSPR